MMLRRFLILLSIVPAVALADPADAMLARARAARDEGLPQAVIDDLRRALDGETDPKNRTALAGELAHCFVDANREKEAVALLDHEEFRGAPGTMFWLAQAHAQLGNARDALALYVELAGMEEFARRDEAALGMGRMLNALGRQSEAIEALSGVRADGPIGNLAKLESAMILIELNRPREAAQALAALSKPNRRDLEHRTYLEGRIALDRGDAAGALEKFNALAARNRRIAAGAVIGACEALRRLGRPREAEERMEAFIDANPRSPLLPEAMRALDEIHASTDGPSGTELKKWKNDTAQPVRSALAAYYLARDDERQGRTAKAVAGYEAFIATHPRLAPRPEAASRLIGLLLAEGKLEPAVRQLDGAEQTAPNRAAWGGVRFLRGAANFMAGNYAVAGELFLQAAGANPEIEKDAWFNAALAAMLAEGSNGGSRAGDLLRGKYPRLAEEAALASAFHRAALGAPDAGGGLRELARGAQAPGVRDRARFGLAEWRLVNHEAGAGSGDFRRISNSGAPAGQADYFAVYALDDGSQAAIPAVSEAAKKFIEANPDSAREADVRMKWGEVLARGGDYRAARVQFEAAAGAARDRGVAASALFLSARSAARSMDPALLEQAVGLFEEVAKDDGPLAAQARLEQALLQNAAGRPDAALVLFDDLIKETADARVRIAAQMKKGDTLFSLGAKDPKRYAEAIAVWNEVAAGENCQPSERNEALAKSADARVKLGEFDAALSAYYRVLSAPRDAQPEYFWYYKAGFDAAHLLESRNQFKEAIAIYEKMAASDGPRSGEARDRVKRLRLENFIWEN